MEEHKVARPRVFFKDNCMNNNNNISQANIRDICTRYLSRNLDTNVQKKISQALKDIEPVCKVLIIEDIALNRGFYKSEASNFMGVEAYYNRKNHIKQQIAIVIAQF